jgi:hypothetical protein
MIVRPQSQFTLTDADGLGGDVFAEGGVAWWLTSAR